MPINEEYIFTYEDYLAIKNDGGLLSIAEEGKEYKLDSPSSKNNEIVLEPKTKIHQKHDKSFKDVLSDQKEMALFLRTFVGIKIETEELQEYKNEFITKQYGKKQADIIYRNTKKKIYYIVEHQSSKDIRMPYRIAEYCLELMRNVEKNSNCKSYPTIVPIVLYTGEGKWDVETNFAERQKYSIGNYEEYKIDIKYTVVDINTIEDIELLEKQDYLANIMLMEKCKTNEKRIEMLKKIYNEMKSYEQKEKILNYVINIYNQTLETEEIKRLYEILERSDDKMTAMYQYIIQERNENIRKGRAEGRTEGRTEGRAEERIEIAKKLLKIKMPIEQISEVTGLSREEVEKISKTLKEKVDIK